MQITREDLNPCTIKIGVVCTPDQVRIGFEKAYKEAGKGMRIPGFRPGHAPAHLVKQRADRSAIMDFAAEHIVNSAYKAAIEEEKIEPNGQAALEITALDEEEGKCEFNAKVPLAPQVELGPYKELTIQKQSDEVTDADVEAYLEDMRNRQGNREAITDRAAEEGDLAVVNIKLEGETGDGRSFMVVLGKTFKALDEALTGMHVEAMKSLDLSFPKNFEEKDWAGKKKHVTLTLRSLSTVSLPELDDEFAKSVKAENLDDLKARLRVGLQGAKRDAIQEYVNETILEAILSKSTVHVPDTMWEQVAQRKLQDIAGELQRNGKKFEDYAQENGMTPEELVEAQKAEAKVYVMRAVVIQRIYAEEKMKLTDAEVNAELFLMARELEIPPQELLTLLRKNRALDDLIFRATYRKVTKFLNDNAKFEIVA